MKKKMALLLVSMVLDKKEKLLQAFQECQEGRCSCPTEEYKKLESLEIKHNDESIELHLKSKHGTKINKAEINKCLDVFVYASRSLIILIQ